MSRDEIESEFKKWWQDSYGLPPGKRAVMTHVPFVIHILAIIDKKRGGGDASG